MTDHPTESFVDTGIEEAPADSGAVGPEHTTSPDPSPAPEDLNASTAVDGGCASARSSHARPSLNGPRMYQNQASAPARRRSEAVSPLSFNQIRATLKWLRSSSNRSSQRSWPDRRRKAWAASSARSR